MANEQLVSVASDGHEPRWYIQLFSICWIAIRHFFTSKKDATFLPILTNGSSLPGSWVLYVLFTKKMEDQHIEFASWKSEWTLRFGMIWYSVEMLTIRHRTCCLTISMGSHKSRVVSLLSHGWSPGFGSSWDFIRVCFIAHCGMIY